MTTFERHKAAILRGEITKTNVIGIRKALNHAARLCDGFSGNRSNVTVAEARELHRLLIAREPRVVGDLHETGLKVLRSRRWRNRFTDRQAIIIERLDHFRLVGFDQLDTGLHHVPVYRAVSRSGWDFCFRNIPWQSAVYQGEPSGPMVLRGN